MLLILGFHILDTNFTFLFIFFFFFSFFILQLLRVSFFSLLLSPSLLFCFFLSLFFLPYRSFIFFRIFLLHFSCSTVFNPWHFHLLFLLLSFVLLFVFFRLFIYFSYFMNYLIYFISYNATLVVQPVRIELVFLFLLPNLIYSVPSTIQISSSGRGSTALSWLFWL